MTQMAKTQSSSRSYSDRTLKLLWGRAAGRCAFPDCRIEIYEDPKDDYDPIVCIGEIAHVEASSDDGPRANPTLTARERDDYDNLILLCSICHKRVDGRRREFSVERLQLLKADHEVWVRESLPERGRTTQGWIPFILEGEHPIDAELCKQALHPDFASREPFLVRVSPADTAWGQIGETIESQTAQLLAASDTFNERFAVFPLAPVSACIALGRELTNRPHVRLFQYHRDDQSWAWPSHDAKITHVTVSALPTDIDQNAEAVVLCFQLSGRITAPMLAPHVDPGFPRIDFVVPEPGTGWLRATDQLDRLGMLTRAIFEGLTAIYPNASRWHLFYAGPAPGAVRIGQQLNPTMTPSVQLYEFIRSATPHYAASLLLGGAP